MIPTIGLIFSVYALARLIQVPIEASVCDARVTALTVISVLSGLVIAFLAMSLMTSGLSTPSVPVGR